MQRKFVLASFGLILFSLLILAGCSGSSTRITQPKPDSSVPISPGFTSIPFPKEEPGVYGPPRQTAEAAEYQIDPTFAYQLGSGASINKDTGMLELNPEGQPGEIAWYMGRMIGFDASKGLNPVSLAIDLQDVKYTKDKNLSVAYLALSNYTKGSWEWFQVSTLGGKAITKSYPQTKYVYTSAKGYTYFILLVYKQQSLKVTNTTVVATDKLIGVPEAIITTEDKEVNLINTKIEYSGAKSKPSEDAEITEYIWKLDGEIKLRGPKETKFQVPTDKVGTFDVVLEIKDSNGLSNKTTTSYTTKQGRTDALLIYNSDEPISIAVKDYYADMYTGRGFAQPFILGLPLGKLVFNDKSATVDYSVSREDYDNKIRIPIENYLTTTEFQGVSLKDTIKYLILCKGIPITIADGGTDYKTGRTCSVDSELTLIFKSAQYDPAGHCTVGEMYGNKPPGSGQATSTNPKTSFYGDNSLNASGFVPNYFKVYDFTEPTPNQITLTYLVARLDGYNLDDVKAIIDRARATKDVKPTDGWWICDDEAPTAKTYDRMTAPANEYTYWKWPLPAWDYFASFPGMKYYNEASPEFVDKSFIAANFTNSSTVKVVPSVTNGDEISNAVLGYTSHGVHASKDPGVLYILNNLKNFKLLPGAVFNTYESFNGKTEKWYCVKPEENHNGQGHVADWFRIGGTAAIANVEEPYADACADERFLYTRLFLGDNFIEAAYKSLMYTSWQEVVVGDPYFRLGYEIPVP